MTFRRKRSEAEIAYVRAIRVAELLPDKKTRKEAKLAAWKVYTEAIKVADKGGNNGR